MVFISMNTSLEEFLKIDRDTRLSQIDWLLFDKYIKGRSLIDRSDLFGSGNHGNLGTYITRTFYYPFYYKEPLHMYLMKEKAFKEIDFLPEECKNVETIWNMKRVKQSWEEEKYPRISEDEMLWNGTYEENKKFLRNAFERLANCKNDISHVCIGET